MKPIHFAIGSISFLILGIFAFLYYVMVYLMLPPVAFTPKEVVISPGDSLQTISHKLEAQNVVRSSYALQLVFSLFEDSTQIKAGTFIFDEAQTTRDIAKTLIAGQFDTELIEVTFLEGVRATAYGEIAKEQIGGFDIDQWNLLIADQEGRLFPDTYFVPPDYTAEQLFALLREQHDATLQELTESFALSSLSEEEVIILASILEREANTTESMQAVAGIFLNRLEIGMALQADATIEYVLETPLGELPPGQLAAELREIDSLYNTYKYPGLPPTPIGNPGKQAIEAVLNPDESSYLYYITGNDGEFYYAETYNQHLTNIERHLR